MQAAQASGEHDDRIVRRERSSAAVANRCDYMTKAAMTARRSRKQRFTVAGLALTVMEYQWTYNGRDVDTTHGMNTPPTAHKSS